MFKIQWYNSNCYTGEDESHSQELNSCKSELDGMTKKNGQLEQESKNLQVFVVGF